MFETNCVKAQDNLLQMPKTLSLQQCLTVCHHYESLKLHIQQIRPDKHVAFLKKCHPAKKIQGPRSSNPVNRDRSQSRRNQTANTQTGQSTQSESRYLPYRKCSGCGHDYHRDRACQCPVWDKTCRKCNRQKHYETACGM